MTGEVWSADQWIDWLRNRERPPHISGLRDCADVLEAELRALRAQPAFILVDGVEVAP